MPTFFTYSVGKFQFPELSLQLRFVYISTSYMAHTEIFNYFKHWAKKEKAHVRDNMLKWSVCMYISVWQLGKSTNWSKATGIAFSGMRSIKDEKYGG